MLISSVPLSLLPTHTTEETTMSSVPGAETTNLQIFSTRTRLKRWHAGRSDRVFAHLFGGAVRSQAGALGGKRSCGLVTLPPQTPSAPPPGRRCHFGLTVALPLRCTCEALVVVVLVVVLVLLLLLTMTMTMIIIPPGTKTRWCCPRPFTF